MDGLSTWLVAMSGDIALLLIDVVESSTCAVNMDSMSMVWTAPFSGKAGCMTNTLNIDQPGIQQPDFFHVSCCSSLVLREFFS